MKVICVIPARYSSSRFPGKPIADICGRPMLWWVYNRCKKISQFADVICAVDDKRIVDICEKYGMNYVLTRNDHLNHMSRIHEVSEKVEADYYLVVCGDEPLISESCIVPMIPTEMIHGDLYFSNAMRALTNIAEALDFSNIKVVVSDTGRCLYMSRSPIPYPRGSLEFTYKKCVGVECFNKEALDFFVQTPQSSLEKIEDIDHLRFLENGVQIYFKMIESESISVDTPKDLDYVRDIIRHENYFD